MKAAVMDTQQRLATLEQDKRLARLPDQSAIDFLLGDPKWDALPCDKGLPALAVALAELYFGEDVLKESTLTGKNGCKLDYRILSRIDDDIRRKFHGRVEQENFPQILALCRKSISTRCKTIRARSKPMKDLVKKS